MECVLATDFPYVFIPGFLNGGSIDLLHWMILWGGMLGAVWEFKSFPLQCRVVSWPPHTRYQKHLPPSVAIETVLGIVKYSLGDKIASS